MDKYVTIKNNQYKYKEIILYLVFGVLTTAVSLGVYYACTVLFLNPYNAFQLQIANVLSWVCAVTFAYLTNRKYVFESNNKNIWKEAGTFALSRLTTLLIDMSMMLLLVTLLGMNDKVAKIIVQVIVTVSNYLLSKLLVFKSK